MALDRRAFLGATSAAAMAGAATAQTAPPVKPTLGVRPEPSNAPLDARSARAGSVTDRLARHVVGVRYADLTPSTIAKAKHRVLDLIGCAIGGVRGEGNAALAGLARTKAGAPEASVLGFGFKAPAEEAAMVNAVVARSFDFEVMTVVAGDHEVASHHSPTTCMTALALCEQKRLGGKDFLAALIVGDDLAARALAASGLDFGQGWDGSPVYGALGGAAIASRLLGLDAGQTQSALGLTVDQIAGTIQSLWDGGTNWKLQQGMAARNAIFCARLAQQGWSSMNDALLAPYGFFAQYTSGCAYPDALTADLGKAFYAEEYFKPYPSCAANHPSIECALSLREAHGIEPRDIRAVRVKVQPGTLRVFVAKPFAATPSAHCQTNFSLPFAVCNTLLRGDFRQEHYDPEALADPQLRRLIAATSLGPMPPGTRGVRIEVTMADGRVLAWDRPQQASRYPRQTPATHDEIVAKFRRQASFGGLTSTADQDEIIRRIGALEQEADMAQFVRLLARSAKPT